jgi:hypothetical protein
MSSHCATHSSSHAVCGIAGYRAWCDYLGYYLDGAVTAFGVPGTACSGTLAYIVGGRRVYGAGAFRSCWRWIRPRLCPELTIES